MRTPTEIPQGSDDDFMDQPPNVATIPGEQSSRS